jgi:hypothetical protein
MCLRQVTRTLLLAVILCMTLSISASALDHCWVPHGQTYTIDEHSTCRRVTNNHASGSQIFVPTKSSAEWSTGANAFINATPPGVTLSACVPSGFSLRSASSTGGDDYVIAPSDIQPGDLLVLYIRVQADESAPAGVASPGFTTLGFQSWPASGSDRASQTLRYKIANGSEAGASIPAGSASQSSTKYLLVFDARATSVTPSTFNTSAGNLNPAPQTVSSSASTGPTLVLAGYGSTGVIDPVGMIPAKDGEYGAGTRRVAWKFFQTSPVNVTVDMDDEGNRNFLQSGYLQITQLAGGGGGTSCVP